MTDDTGVDLVTGAFSYSGSHIAEHLLHSGRQVRTLTFHLDRPHRLNGRIDARPYRFGDPAALARSLEGVTNVYNTYWVRFDHGSATFANAVAELADAVLCRPACRRRASHPPEHRQSRAGVAASVLPGQGTR